MQSAAIEWAVDQVLRGLSGGAPPSPSLAMFLLRAYADQGRRDVRDALEGALAQGLDIVSGEPDPGERCEWLRLFDQAASISTDERLGDAVRSSIASAVDDLERLVGSQYEPGEGLDGGGLDDHLRRALALLAAFEITGRLPYAMLAEELVQVVRRRWWDEERGLFGHDFESDCRGTQLLCRLAALHEDPTYTQAVAIAHRSPYRVDAERVLASLDSVYRNHEPAAAAYGLALVEWLALTSNLH